MHSIEELRAVYHELRRLLLGDPASLQRLVPAETAFAPFEPLLARAESEPSVSESKEWESAVAAFEELIRPAESVAIDCLRRRFGEVGGNAELFLQEVAKFRFLLRRESVAASLQAERAALLALLQNLVDQYTETLQDLQEEQGNRVRQLVAARQMHTTVRSVLDTATQTLRGLEKYSALTRSAEDFLSECETAERQLFSRWCGDAKALLSDEDGGLQADRIMDINHDGELVVNFSSKVVELLREERQLRELSFTIPLDIQKSTKRIDQFYRSGMLLKKVANFYNTIEHQIVESQRPMLLQSLLEFEDAVHSGAPGSATSSNGGSRPARQLSWTDAGACEEYVGKLQKKAEELATENRKLRHAHDALRKQVPILM